MKHIFLTAEEAIAASGSSVSTENLDAFLETINKMEPNEVIAKYGERVLWSLVVLVIGSILVRWAINIIMRYIGKSELAAGATNFIRGIIAFLL